MKIWIDAQLPPKLVGWLRRHFDLEALHVFDAGLLTDADHDIFHAARLGDDIILTKDADFIGLVQRHGPPPKIIQVGCGNCTNRALLEIVKRSLPSALDDQICALHRHSAGPTPGKRFWSASKPDFNGR